MDRKNPSTCRQIISKKEKSASPSLTLPTDKEKELEAVREQLGPKPDGRHKKKVDKVVVGWLTVGGFNSPNYAQSTS
ncbi:Uncharacterized protein APZ42_027545 [Daphnia magna]|uniref:Uncharacterized protein n=1 Tax=Daphnia magna TaxID=35525 RepID=A0A164R9N6_9CRUS|nr:Uncharacterized protein APZ42_027545 [Daphnia magna]